MFYNKIDLTNDSHSPFILTIDDDEGSQEEVTIANQSVEVAESASFQSPIIFPTLQEILQRNVNNNNESNQDEKIVQNFWKRPLSYPLTEKDFATTLRQMLVSYLRHWLIKNNHPKLINKLKSIADLKKLGIIVYLLNYDSNFIKSVAKKNFCKELDQEKFYDNFIQKMIATINQFKKAHQNLPQKIYESLPSGKSSFLFQFIAELCLTKEGNINHGGLMLAKEIAQSYFKDERRLHILNVLTQLQIDADFQSLMLNKNNVNPALEVDLRIGLNLSTNDSVTPHEVRLYAFISTLFHASKLDLANNSYPEVIINYLAFNNAKKLYLIYFNFLTLGKLCIEGNQFPNISTAYLFADQVNDNRIFDIKMPVQEIKNLFVIQQLCSNSPGFDLDKATKDLIGELTIGEFLNAIFDPSTQELARKLIFEISFKFTENRLQQTILRHIQFVAYSLRQLANCQIINSYAANYPLGVMTSSFEQLQRQLHLKATLPSEHIRILLHLFKLNPNLSITNQSPHSFFMELFDVLKHYHKSFPNDSNKKKFTLMAVSGPTENAPCEQCFTLTPCQFQEIWATHSLPKAIEKYLLVPASKALSGPLTAQKADFILMQAFQKNAPDFYKSMRVFVANWTEALNFYNSVGHALFQTSDFDAKFTQAFNYWHASIDKENFLKETLELFIKEHFPDYEEDIFFIRNELNDVYSQKEESFISLYNLVCEIQCAMRKLKKRIPASIEIEKKLQLFFNFPMTIELADLHYAKDNQESPSHLKLVGKMHYFPQQLEFYYRFANVEAPLTPEEAQMYKNISLFLP